MELLETKLFDNLIQRYKLFVKDIRVEIQKKESMNSVFFSPQLTLKKELCPKDYYQLKQDIYEVVYKTTNLKPVASSGWKVSIVGETNKVLAIA